MEYPTGGQATQHRGPRRGVWPVRKTTAEGGRHGGHCCELAGRQWECRSRGESTPWRYKLGEFGVRGGAEGGGNKRRLAFALSIRALAATETWGYNSVNQPCAAPILISCGAPPAQYHPRPPPRPEIRVASGTKLLLGSRWPPSQDPYRSSKHSTWMQPCGEMHELYPACANSVLGPRRGPGCSIQIPTSACLTHRSCVQGA